MQFPWLEKMAAAGDIRPEAKAQIYADCSRLLKQAGDGSKVKAVGKAVGESAANYGTMLLVDGAWNRLVSHHAMKNTLKSIQSSRAGILSDPAFNDYKEKADARFTELAKVAPTLAADAKKSKDLVGKALHTGFSNDDMNHLAILQAVYTANDPSYAGKVQSGLEKKASLEKLGELYADVVLLVKEAGLLSGILSGIQRGGAAAAEGMAKATGGVRPGTAMQVLRNVALVSSIPLLAGVGQGLVSEYAASRDSRKMADRLRNSFEEAMRQSKKDDPNQTRGVSLDDNPGEAYRAFQSLVHFAPHVALHPDSARTWMTRMVDHGQFVELPDVKQLTDIERNLSSAGKQSPFFAGFTSAADTLGLGQGIRSSIKDSTDPLHQQSQARIKRDLGMTSSKG